MPATSEFLSELELAFRSENLERIILLGMKMMNMGWYGRMGEFLNRLERILEKVPKEERERLEVDENLQIFNTVRYLLSELSPEKARPYLKNDWSCLVFYEYVGDHPKAFEHFQRLNLKDFWGKVRAIYFRMYRGEEVEIEEIEGLEPSDSVPEFVVQVLAKAYTKGLHMVLEGDVGEERFEEIRKAVMYGLGENYDHSVFRVMQVFIPLAVLIGRVGTAKRFVEAAISTASLEKNRYMEEWFKLYRKALLGEREGLRESVETFKEKGYIGHEVLARSIAFNLGVDTDENSRVSEDLSKRYWHRHVLRYAEVLSGGGRSR